MVGWVMECYDMLEMEWVCLRLFRLVRRVLWVFFFLCFSPFFSLLRFLILCLLDTYNMFVPIYPNIPHTPFQHE